jgi:hypothetical protein
VAGSGVVLGAVAFTAICWLLGFRVVEVLRFIVAGLRWAPRAGLAAFRDFRHQTLAAAGAGVAARPLMGAPPFDIDEVAPLGLLPSSLSHEMEEAVPEIAEAVPEPMPAAVAEPPAPIAGGMLDRCTEMAERSSSSRSRSHCQTRTGGCRRQSS